MNSSSRSLAGELSLELNMAAVICEWGQDGVGQGGGSVIGGRSWVPEQDNQRDLSCSAIWHGDQPSECRKGLKSSPLPLYSLEG